MIMNIVKTFIVEDIVSKEQTEWIVLDRGNNEFTSMPKSVYDEQLAKQETNETN